MTHSKLKILSAVLLACGLTLSASQTHARQLTESGKATGAEPRADEREAALVCLQLDSRDRSAKQADRTIRQVLQEAVQAIRALPDPGSRVYGLVEIVKAQGRAGDKEAALESARQAVAAALALDPSAQASALAAIAWARGQRGRPRGALNLLRLTNHCISKIEVDWRQIDAWRIVATSSSISAIGMPRWPASRR